MSVRFSLGVSALVSLLAPLTAACEDGYDDPDYGESANEVVFGIKQRVDAATGKNEVTAGYDFIGLAHRGGSLTHVFRDGDGEGTCYFERYDNRLGSIRVESGVATWKGGKLPTAGLQVLANQPEAKLSGDGWGANDTLTFDVTGFAMPQLKTVTIPGPRLDLANVVFAPAPAEGATAMSIKASDKVTVTWNATSTIDDARVMVTLETDEDGAGGGVRCFGRASSGSAVIPAEWVGELFSSVDPATTIKGRVAISSHRQITYYARGSWTAYIVAATQHQEQLFNGVR